MYVLKSNASFISIIFKCVVYHYLNFLVQIKFYFIYIQQCYAVYILDVEL